MSAAPWCPQCSAEGSQTRLTVAAMERVSVGLRREIAAHFDTAHQCGVCGAIYSFRSDVSLAFAAKPTKQPQSSDAPSELEHL
jgi:hypothetical protein